MMMLFGKQQQNTATTIIITVFLTLSQIIVDVSQDNPCNETESMFHRKQAIYAGYLLEV